MSLKWLDIQDLAFELAEAHPEVDPISVRFTDLMAWILALEEFDDDPKHCSERILEAVQQAWIEELE